MPVDDAFTSPLSSSFFLNVDNLDTISPPPKHRRSVDRKRKYFEVSLKKGEKLKQVQDEDQDVRSSHAPFEFNCFTFDDQKRDEKNANSSTSLDFMDKAEDKQDPNLNFSFTSETDQQIMTSPRKQGMHLLSEDRAVPSDNSARAVLNDTGTKAVPKDGGAKAVLNDRGTRASPNETGARAVPNDSGARAVPSDWSTRALPIETRMREELSSILHDLPSRDAFVERDFGSGTTQLENKKDSSSSCVQLPMKNLLEGLAQQMKDSIVQDWSGVFSNMESFETVNLENLDQILTAALAYEARLKSEKAELRNFLAKLSGVLQHD